KEAQGAPRNGENEHKRGNAGSGDASGDRKKKVVMVRKGVPAGNAGPPAPRPGAPAPAPRRNADDDGTMYNPFAEALKKMREKKR
ncbi:MAG: hypothetical protein LBL43_06000, partial [Treponema sp.]|nr:hypothetical protein [Treponema sp.]